MEPPLAVRFSDEDRRELKIYNACPSGYIHKIAFASATHVTSGAGEIISQFINGEDYWVELLNIFTFKNDFVHLEIKKPFFCISVILEGAIPNQTIGGSALNLPKSSYNLFYLPPGLHEVYLSKNNYTILFIVPAFQDVKTMAKEHRGIDYLMKLVEQESPNGAMLESFEFPYQVWDILNELKNCRQSGAALDFTLRKYILEILSLYNNQLSLQSQGKLQAAGERVFKVRDYILANLDNPGLSSVDKLSSLFHITAKTLTREFRTEFNKTVPVYIREVRLDKAYNLLLHTQLSIQEIAEKVGYLYAAHFSRDFKIKYGIPPTEVKKRGRGGDDKRPLPIFSLLI